MKKLFIAFGIVCLSSCTTCKVVGSYNQQKDKGVVCLECEQLKESTTKFFLKLKH